MGCAHYLEERVGAESAFTVDASRITFGASIEEAGPRARSLEMKRVALFSDPHVATTEFFARAERSLRDAGLDPVLFTSCEVEPTDRSFEEAHRFAAEANVDGFVSVGGGSVI